jgi:hypothetical protein
MIMWDWPRDRPVLYQIVLTFSIWMWYASIYGINVFPTFPKSRVLGLSSIWFTYTSAVSIPKQLFPTLIPFFLTAETKSACSFLRFTTPGSEFSIFG